MSGDDAPEMNTFDDYLSWVLPICFGVLNMTAEEIYDSTPWEIDKRIDGYLERQRQKRIFYASFLTVPIMNAGFNRTKRGVKLEDIVGDDLTDQNLTEGELDRWRNILNKAKEGG